MNRNRLWARLKWWIFVSKNWVRLASIIVILCWIFRRNNMVIITDYTLQPLDSIQGVNAVESSNLWYNHGFKVYKHTRVMQIIEGASLHSQTILNIILLSTCMQQRCHPHWSIHMSGKQNQSFLASHLAFRPLVDGTGSLDHLAAVQDQALQ